ncbi:MAG: hypothetical protein QF475_01775 [Candidatus Undinarchaeales archaeon]|jgi:hypothetical protein|nr:hypothetical protein [Candidatus Undinarchaeales archaeon]
MDIPNLIRAGILLTVGLLVILFPEQIVNWQIRFEKRYFKWVIRKKYRITYVELGKKTSMKLNFMFAIICFIISAALLVYSVLV